MQLGKEQIQQFREQGYLAVPDFWDADETAAMQAEVERLKRDGLLRNVATEGDGKTQSQTKANLQLCPMYDKSDFFRAMPFAPKVVEAVRQLIGDPVLLHLDQVFLKPARHGAGTNWHQDNAYFHIADPLKGTALWTAVHDATVANGTLHVVPNAFRKSLEHRRDPDSDHHIRCWPDETKAVPVELPAGGVVFFAYGTPHCTLGNTTEKERAGMALHFLNGDEDGEAKGGFGIGKRPILTGPDASGGEQEYGVRVAGTWEQEVERVQRETTDRNAPRMNNLQTMTTTGLLSPDQERIRMGRKSLVAVLAVGIAFALTILFQDVLQHTMSLLLLTAVVLATSYGGLIPGLVATLCALMACAWVLPPVHSFGVSYPGHVSLAVFALVSTTVCVFSESLHTARRRAETSRQQTEEASRNLKLLAKVGKTLIASDNAEVALRQAAHLTVPEFADWCLVDLLGEKGGLRSAVIAHQDSDRVLQAHAFQRSCPPGLSALSQTERALSTGQPELGLHIPASRIDALACTVEEGEWLRGMELNSYLCVPLLAPDGALGTVTFFWAESGRHYGPTELDWAWDFASRCSLVVSNAHLRGLALSH